MEIQFGSNGIPLINDSSPANPPKKTIEHDAVIRFGKSIVNHNTGGGLDLVIDDTFISLFPSIEAVYFISKVGVSEKEMDDDKYGWSSDFFDFDYSIAISRSSKYGYLWLTTDERAFLEYMKYPSRDTDWLKNVYRKAEPKVPSDQLIGANSGVDLIDCVVTHNSFGGRDLVINDTYVSINSGVKAVYYLPEDSCCEGDAWGRAWSLIEGVVSYGIGVYQKSLVGNTWWIYDEIAYAKECRIVGLDPIQFKISPKEIF